MCGPQGLSARPLPVPGARPTRQSGRPVCRDGHGTGVRRRPAKSRRGWRGRSRDI